MRIEEEQRAKAPQPHSAAVCAKARAGLRVRHGAQQGRARKGVVVKLALGKLQEEFPSVAAELLSLLFAPSPVSETVINSLMLIVNK